MNSSKPKELSIKLDNYELLVPSLDFLLKSSIITKSKTKVNGDELICQYPYLNSTINQLDIEINKEIDNMLNHRDNISDEDFSFYLAGLIEGDGHCTIDNIGITFNVYDTNLAVYIRDRIGEGHIYKNDGNCVTLYFKRKEAIEKVSKIINGKFYTEYKINFMKKHNYPKKYNIKILSPINQNQQPIMENYFLAGFADADSCFDIKSNLYPRFRIKQKDTTIINLLKEDYGGTIYLNKTECSDYEVAERNLIGKYIDYFEKYKLLSTKYINYILWKKVVELKKNKTHNTKEGKEEILKLKKIMNSKLFNNLSFLAKSTTPYPR